LSVSGLPVLAQTTAFDTLQSSPCPSDCFSQFIMAQSESIRAQPLYEQRLAPSSVHRQGTLRDALVSGSGAQTSSRRHTRRPAKTLSAAEASFLFALTTSQSPNRTGALGKYWDHPRNRRLAIPCSGIRKLQGLEGRYRRCARPRRSSRRERQTDAARTRP
jgi:hypothetical protein